MQVSEEQTGPIRRVQGTRRFGNGAKLVALVAIAVVSGVIWWLANRDGSGQDPEQAAGQSNAGTPGSSAANKPRFERVGGPVDGDDCRKRSYGTAKKYFKEHNCAALHQVLYASETERGKVLSSVSTVTMASPGDANGLKRLTDSDGTGNVTDLVTAGVRLPGGPKTVKGSGYASKVRGNTMIVVESGFFASSQHGDAFLTKVSKAALAKG
ncbi:hypothetical protein [Sciscionella marina]|uniref:hypothetical protein n=1 Tax=Sciscionella marina TaxID=508770 RepID=UPI00039E474E|nr:hypothetical protein [Sciscionella marina]